MGPSIEEVTRAIEREEGRQAADRTARHVSTRWEREEEAAAADRGGDRRRLSPVPGDGPSIAWWDGYVERMRELAQEVD